MTNGHEDTKCQGPSKLLWCHLTTPRVKLLGVEMVLNNSVLVPEVGAASTI